MHPGSDQRLLGSVVCIPIVTEDGAGGLEQVPGPWLDQQGECVAVSTLRARDQDVVLRAHVRNAFDLHGELRSLSHTNLTNVDCLGFGASVERSQED